MPVSGEQSIRNLLNEKLTALSGVLRLGGEAAQKGSLEAVGMHIVNNSRMLVHFDRSSLVDLRSGEPDVIAIMGVSELNANSEYCVNLKALLKAYKGLSKPQLVREESLKEAKASDDALKAYEYFKGKMEDILLIPMRPPESTATTNDSELFIWVVEFHENMGTDTEKLLILLSHPYAVAIWYSLRRKFWPTGNLLSRKIPLLSPGRLLLASALALLLALFVIRVDQSALADFQLDPPDKTIQYAPFNGTLKKSFFRNGQEVKKGAIIIEYDVDELNYELASSRKEYDEICAELDLTRQNSFSKSEELGKLKLLEAKRDRKKVDIDKAQWLLSKSVMKADRDGLLVIEDPDMIAGKSVSAGAVLYEIMPPGELIAETFLNETDATVICPEMKITLYLHSRPANALKTKLLSVSPRPSIQENRQFCYVIKSEIEKGPEGLICGMRGVAKLSGRKVSLGYYLFRNAMLWWRRI